MRHERRWGTESRSHARVVTAALVVAGAVLIPTLGCGPAGVNRTGPDACGALDSLFAHGGVGGALAIAGQATIDADQLRMRGKMVLDVRAPREMAFEFTSTMLFGHAREDFVFSLSGDTLRIVDRERGAYYEGAEAESFLADSFDADFDLPQMLSLALGSRPPCEELSNVSLDIASSGETVCSGRRFGKPFRVVFGLGGGRLREVEWPVRSERYESDRLRVGYEWGAGEGGESTLSGLVLTLEVREWRCKIKAARPG